jgi:hypothetical protein
MIWNIVNYKLHVMSLSHLFFSPPQAHNLKHSHLKFKKKKKKLELKELFICAKNININMQALFYNN